MFMYVYVYKLPKGNLIYGATNAKNIKKEKKKKQPYVSSEWNVACLFAMFQPSWLRHC